MDSKKIRQSIITHTRLWIVLWLIVVIDLGVILGLSFSFNLPLMVGAILAAGGGLAAIKMLAAVPIPEETAPPVLGRAASYGLSQLMDEIRPRCDEIFAREIDSIAQPVIDHMRSDFTSALGWLWEGGDDFLRRLEESIYEIRHVIHLVSSMGSDTVKIIQRLKYDLDIMVRAVEDIQKQRDKNYDELDRFLASKVAGLKQSMDREKDIFYDYVQRMLIERIQEEPEGSEALEYFNISRLGEQFSNVVEKSVQARLDYFEKSVLYDLEQLAADIVGKIQKGTLHLMTTLKEIEELLGSLLEDDRHESGLTIRKLAASRDKVVSLKEESNDIMLTLAWSDILTAKRWQAMQERLQEIKEEVRDNMDEEFHKYIAGRLDEEMPEYYNLSSNNATAMIYQNLLDAETVYHATAGESPGGVRWDRVYVMLEFLKPVEAMAAHVIRLSSESAEKRRSFRERARKNEFQAVFDQVIQELEGNYPAYVVYLDGLFPQSFNAFCNNPNIEGQPENAGQAAWMVFIQLIESPRLPAEFYLLTALLLYIHQMREQYIHPLKSQALPLQRAGDADDMREAAFRAIKILMLYDTYKHKLP